MKRLLISGLVLVAMTSTVSAQEISRRNLGIKGGVNYMNVYSEGVEEFNYLTSFAIGVFYQCNVHPRFSFSPEIYYSVKGAKEEALEGSVDWKLGYIDIPVLFKLMFPTESVATPFLYAGGYYSFLMSAKEGDHDAKDKVNGTDGGLIIGVGVDLELKGGKQLVDFDIRYTWGLMNIIDVTDVPERNNGGFQFLFGWGFNL